MGGGAAQILFALFGEQVFHRGAAGIGVDLGVCRNRTVDRAARSGMLPASASGLPGVQAAVTLSYLLHGAAYMLFSQVESYSAALVCDDVLAGGHGGDLGAE